MTLRIDDRGAVRWLTLDRPDTRNGLTVDITKAIAAALRDLTETTRAIVITGANGAFCSGLDLKDAMRRGLQSGPELERGLREDFHGAIKAFIECDRPTIAAVDGLGRAFELLLTGDLVRAEEAYRIGLANRVVPQADLITAVTELSERLAKGPPLVHRLVKRAVYAGLDSDLATALDREAKGQLQLLGSRDFGEGVTAFLQKRDPRFQGH